MRLWHYRLISFLPDSQLKEQWKDLNTIFRRQPRDILIDYVYLYPKADLLTYTDIVMSEMIRRGMKPKIGAGTPFTEYFGIINPSFSVAPPPFRNHHNFPYLRQCYYMLEERFFRAQLDFDSKQFGMLEILYENEKARFQPSPTPPLEAVKEGIAKNPISSDEEGIYL